VGVLGCVTVGVVRSFYLATDEQIRELVLAPDKYASIDAFLGVAKQSWGDPGCACVDKAWAGLHFLLAWPEGRGGPPLDFLRYGAEHAELVGDVGYGRAHAFRAAETEAIAGALRGVTPWTLRVRFDPRRMDELGIYPRIWIASEIDLADTTQRDLDRENRDYLIGHFVRLKRFLRAAARKGLGVVTFSH
jgi:Domain of unknown function (DUF1877)